MKRIDRDLKNYSSAADDKEEECGRGLETSQRNRSDRSYAPVVFPEKFPETDCGAQVDWLEKTAFY